MDANPLAPRPRTVLALPPVRTDAVYSPKAGECGVNPLFHTLPTDRVIGQLSDKIHAYEAHIAELQQQLLGERLAANRLRTAAVKAMVELQLRRKHLSAGWEHLPDVIQPPPPLSPAPIPLRALRPHCGVYGLQTLQDWQ